MIRELVRDDGFRLAAWGDYCNPGWAFPKDLWNLGIMLVGDQPLVVDKWVELHENGLCQWRKTVPKGAAKRRRCGRE